MDGPWGHYTKWNKPVTHTHTHTYTNQHMYDSTYMFPRLVKFIDRESGVVVVSRGWGIGEGGVIYRGRASVLQDGKVQEIRCTAVWRHSALLNCTLTNAYYSEFCGAYFAFYFMLCYSVYKLGRNQRWSKRQLWRQATWVQILAQTLARWVRVCVLSLSVVSDSVTPMDCSPQDPRSWDSPGKNAGVGCHALLQGIFLTEGSNPRQILYCWSSGEAWLDGCLWANRVISLSFFFFFPLGLAIIVPVL